MQLSTRQTRVYMLASLLSNRKPVAASQLLAELDCSEPTLTRVLKELRESWSAEIKYSRGNQSYVLVDSGKLDKKSLRYMNEALKFNAELQTADTQSRVFLDKEKKKAVSLSLRMSVLRKIDQISLLSEITRSEAAEMIVNQGFEAVLERLRRS